MGVEPFLLASSVRLILAQRLVRRLCPHCRRAEPADAATARLAGVAEGQVLYRAQGCAQCGQTGYVGRVGVYEAIRVDETIRRLISEGAAEDEIARTAREAGGGTLAQEARACVLEGLTTVEEALRVTRQEGSAHGEL